MIDEELYKLASLELNSDQRRQELWARAVALASDDHDEARYLYTNLRVEEMVNERRNPSVGTAGDLDADYHPPAATGSITAQEDANTIDYNATTGTPMMDIDSTEGMPEFDEFLEDDQNQYSATHPQETTDSLLPANEQSLDQLAENDQTVKISELPAHSSAITDMDAASQVENQHDTVYRADSQSELAELASPTQIDVVDDSLKSDITPGTIHAEPHYSSAAAGKVYNVFERYDGRVKAIKQGVSWPAMLFTLPWLLSRKLWGTALVYLIMGAVLLSALLVTGLQIIDAGSAATTLMKMIFAGFAVLAFIGLIYLPFRHGNSWVAQRMERDGYESGPAVIAHSAADALLRVQS